MNSAKTGFRASDPNFAARVRADFAKQKVMETLGVQIVRVAPGAVELEMNFAPTLTQQHGFLHAGIVTTALDSACGYAAFTLMPAGAQVLTVEFKSNFLAPASGERFVFRGAVLRAGRTITVCSGEAVAVGAQSDTLVATMTCTLMAVTRTP